MPTVLVVSRERNFRSLLRAQLREEGLEALGFESLEEAAQALSSTEKPVLVCNLADLSDSERSSLLTAWLGHTPAVMVASAGDQVDFPGAQVLRRPLTIREVVTAVRAAARTAA